MNALELEALEIRYNKAINMLDTIKELKCNERNALIDRINLDGSFIWIDNGARYNNTTLINNIRRAVAKELKKFRSDLEKKYNEL